nr:unnamed protein product [uncultured bacterium]
MNCFVLVDDTTVFSYDIPNCKVGDTLSVSDNTEHDIYKIINNKLIKQSISNYNYQNKTYYVYSNTNGSLGFNTNFLILPAVILVICMFSIIYKWIKGTRYV